MFYSNTLISDVLIILIIVCKNIKNCWMNVELCVYKLVPLHLCWHLCVSVHVSNDYKYTERRVSVHTCEDVVLIYTFICIPVWVCVCVCVWLCGHVCLCVYIWVCLCFHVHLYVCDIWNTHVYSLSLDSKFIDFSLRNSRLVRIRTVFSYCFVYILSHYLTLLYVEMHRRTILHTKTMYLRMNMSRKTWLRKINAGKWVIQMAVKRGQMTIVYPHREFSLRPTTVSIWV